MSGNQNPILVDTTQKKKVKKITQLMNLPKKKIVIYNLIDFF